MAICTTTSLPWSGTICALLQFPEFEFERMCKGFGGGRSGASGKPIVDARPRNLEVDENADQAEIKRAYRRQMNRHHPDNCIQGHA
ncbi:MAG: DnaJ domain-containing protein [Candidatus Eutrophobiaceae bacterium]